MPDRYPPASVVAKLKRYDRELNLKWHVDRWKLYRGSIFIGSCAPDLLGDGTMLLNKLHAGDIWKQHGSAKKAGEFLDNQEAKEKELRDKQRRENFVDNGKEMYDDLARRAGRRINNAGMPS